MKLSSSSNDTGYRFQSDKRQAGGLLMLLGFCAIVQPAADIVSGFGPDGALVTDAGEIPFWQLVGGLCVFINGILAVTLGYLATVHDYTHVYFTQLLMVTIQTAWIPYITNMTAVGKGARSGHAFIPDAYEPTEGDVKFVGAMGILGILAYGFGFVGAFSFQVFNLHVFTVGKPEERSGSYFKGRLGFYSGVMVVGGLAQFLLGAYCATFDSKVLDQGPVGVAMFMITYPAIAMIIGLIQTVNGCWGVLRMFGVHAGADDNSYQLIALVQWMMVVVLQVVTQIAYLPGGAGAPAAPTIIAMSLGLNIMPAYLDHKMRTTPEVLPENYYSSVDTSEEEEVGKTIEPTATCLLDGIVDEQFDV